MANIKVAVRVRPISEREIHFTGSEIVVRTEEKAISLTNLKVSSSKAGDSRERTRTYGFDYCFDSSDPNDEKYATQSMIYKTLGESILDVLFRGYNSCLVAYGQSASGKTYTMMGSKEDPGLTPRICQGLFLRLANEENNNTNFKVSVSYLEVYNERVRDLLKPSSNSIGLRVREHPRLGPYVQGLTHHAVSTLGSLISQVEEGTRARKTASTLQNPTSSRSHALLTLSLVPATINIGESVKDKTVKSKNIYRGNEHSVGGSKLHLVDLAGSESATACGGVNRLKEGANINKSLVALGNVISALAERASSGRGPGRRFIPYRDSALTWLLKDALGGNATTIMLATISPASGSYNETSHTLRFAQRAQSVVNRPVINEDPVSRIIKELRAEVARLKSLLLEKNVDPDCKSICMCQRDQGQELKAHNHDSPEIGASKAAEKKSEGTDECELSIQTRYPRVCERRHSTSEDLLSRKNVDSPVKRFASFEIVGESEKSPLASIEVDNYNRAKVSELISDDEINEPVFVDIPTLVAVLIKPEDDIQEQTHQIEGIGSDDVPEDDVEFSKNLDNQIFSINNQPQDLESTETSVGIISCSELSKDLQFLKKNPESSSELSSNHREKGKLRRHDSIDVDLPVKSSYYLQVSKKYGSIENLSKKQEIACALQRSQTNLEKRNGSLDKIKKLNNIREVDNHRSNKSINSWRNFSTWSSKDFQRKGSNDSGKSLKESSSLLKSKNQSRKQSIDGLKRKTSKDSSSSSSKDELTTSGGSRNSERLSRKGSLEHEQISTKTHTPIQRARRAEIVAAVTERLYSSKKLPEDTIALTGTTASTPASEICSPESADVKLANATRMRLQEISRKMLAKRRKICVDTQTENSQTVRVRDASCLTEEPKISSKDASMLTDHHEYSEIIPSTDFPVRRVKEIATSTDSDLRQRVIRCKDAANITEDYHEDYRTMNSPRIDSGIMSDDTQNYAESNLSSAEISDLNPIGGGRIVELVENSTNTRMPPGLPNSDSQTRRADFEDIRRLNYSARCCSGARRCRADHGLNSTCSQTCYHAENNVISIHLPEIMNITIETSVGMESKIKVFDVNESIDDRTVVSVKDNMAQTDKADSLDMGTSTDDISGQVHFHDFSTVMKPIIGQTDGRTFRIENIFHESRDEMKTTRRIDATEASSDEIATTNSFIVTNSIGTSFVPETRENATGMVKGKSYNFESFQSATSRVSSTIDELTKNKCSLVTSSTSNHQREDTCVDYSTLLESQRSLAKISMNDLVTIHNRKTDNIAYEGKGQSTITMNDEVIDEDSGPPEYPIAKTTYEYSNADNGDVLITELKSPAIIAMLDRKVSAEQDTNFSDDSLDLSEDGIIDDNCNSNLLLESERNSAKMEGMSVNEKICPPDLVAHTKKDINDSSSGISPFDDFDEDGQHIEFPKKTVDSSTATDFATPMNNFKTLILGDTGHAVNYALDSNFIDLGNESSTKTFVDSDCLYSTTNVIEDTEQGFVNSGRSLASKSIIKKASSGLSGLPLSNAYQSKFGTKNLGDESCCTKKVRFTIPEVSSMTSSESEASENLTSDDEFSERKPRTILEKYLDEAVIFMRNMNSMNEYMSAFSPLSKRRINDRKRHYRKGKSKNYIEYEGRRISLEDVADKCVMSDEDGGLDFNVESYDECLRSMDRLEKCVAQVLQHDNILRDKYGIGTDESTVAKLDLAKFSIDSSGSNRDVYDVHARKSSNGNNDDGNNNTKQLRKNGNDDYSSESISASSENSENRRIRKFPRFSDLRKRHPTTYSRLRMRYGSQAIDTRGEGKQDIPRSATNIKSLKADRFEDTLAPDSLQTPDCYLILPKTTRNVEHPTDQVKGAYTPCKRFSLSKYDSSDDSSSSNEALASFMESIDDAARSRAKIKYPGSPRAKFLQLLRERRRIVETTRRTSAS